MWRGRSPPIADLQEENGEVVVRGKQKGRATVTATANNQSATAVIAVVDGGKLGPATVRWSLLPVPGFQTDASGCPSSSHRWWPIIRCLLLGRFFKMTCWLAIIRCSSSARKVPLPGTTQPSLPLLVCRLWLANFYFSFPRACNLVSFFPCLGPC